MGQSLFCSCLTTSKLKPLGFLFRALVDRRGTAASQGATNSLTPVCWAADAFCHDAACIWLPVLLPCLWHTAHSTGFSFWEAAQESNLPLGMKKDEGHQPSRNEPASAIGSPDQKRENLSGWYRELHHYISWTSFFIWELFSCLTSECKSGQQNPSKLSRGE